MLRKHLDTSLTRTIYATVFMMAPNYISATAG